MIGLNLHNFQCSQLPFCVLRARLCVWFWCSPPVFLHWGGWCSSPRGPIDLPAAAERHSQADLHLPLPQLCCLAARRHLQPRTRTALQRQQQRGAYTWEHTLHQCAVWRVSGEWHRYAFECEHKSHVCFLIDCVSLLQTRSGQERTVLEFDAPLSNTLPLFDVAVPDFGKGNQKFGFQVGPVCYNG